MRQPLAMRRRRRRLRNAILIGVFCLIAVSAGVYLTQQAFVRIASVEIIEGDPALANVAGALLEGTYAGVVPRNSIFFFPESEMRRTILAKYLGVASVSISRKGFNGISIRANERVPIARWCGPSYRSVSLVASTSSAESREDCYVFDDSGFIFATTSELQIVNPFRVYEPIATGTLPLRSILPQADTLPAVFNFARQLSTLGPPVSAIALHDGEVDCYLENGTRVTYVRGNEMKAYTALISASPHIDLNNDRIQYIDLRFDGKVYLKRE